MQAAVARRLIKLNREFYQTLAGPFSASRGRLQPGVQRVLANVPPEANVLDLGCGNGGVAAELARRGHSGQYVGVDSSAELLAEAEKRLSKFKVESLEFKFIQADLTDADWPQATRLSGQDFDFIFAFAVLHHIPSRESRVQFLTAINRLLAQTAGGSKTHPYESGTLVLSNWQFLNSPRLRSRIQPWGLIGLTEAEVDSGDYLLDWRSGGNGLRYVHQFNETELADLAGDCGLAVKDTFLSDGKSGDLSLYSVCQAV